MKTCVAAFCLLASGLIAVSAQAQGANDDFTFDSEPEWFILSGVGGGGSFGSAGGGGFLGGELSLARIYEGRWSGIFADANYDFGQSRTTLTFGPEFGAAILGVDGGAALRLGGDDLEWGGQGRLTLALGLFSLYGRYGYWPDSSFAKHTGQVGFLFKFPFWSSFEPVPYLR